MALYKCCIIIIIIIIIIIPLVCKGELNMLITGAAVFLLTRQQRDSAEGVITVVQGYFEQFLSILLYKKFIV